MHCHCHEIPIDVLKQFEKDIIIVIVSDDIESSIASIELYRKLNNVIPCIGIHPWSIKDSSREDLDFIVSLVKKYDIACLGEIGLDKRFVPETIEKQRIFFNKFLELAKEYDLVLNLHTAGTWKEVFDLLIRNNIDKAYFHWYTGPLHVLEMIIEAGYYIGANPAWKIQKKHREILMKTPIDSVITESDAPYNYRGLKLSPLHVKDTVKLLADIHRVSIEDVKLAIWNNFYKLLGKHVSKK